ncbi:putative U3 small nucleolar ribonucleoprotein complex, subunit Mpp10 [Helianthus annuus]|nr:putative U3 small nucleolar ribonucleoprotein complex, subunit Mpp10 [Helianthus annuus]KAJ0639771.1 putative U3 small nucleolar ribonucleoprotein complex, subunit Mpp10 [Helianthus annuus]KAJ0643723.1 putative U3 small nucleolar ribonucleoprotein complex, subunit Mpp10 [Helianthus annuus]KAJ0819853.1 putative U3 small nucleolar ribonucleoprotein complex, subunit Mpp10 [Helianthus annuus]KAJ0834410.1 putative U3 small nucleolar ribonucleoprotein complex, subunit Mpp10 [Helianthus annuus]
MAATTTAGAEALHRLKLTEPPMYLTPSSELANLARTASEHLFTLLKPYTPKSPFDRLLVDEKFDAEQIWQQIDLQSQPLISSVRRQVNKFEKDPLEVNNMFKIGESEQEKPSEVVLAGEEEEDDEDEDEDEDGNEDEDEDEGEREIKEKDAGGVGDMFFNEEEMKLMEDDEYGDYGLNKKKQVLKKTGGKFGDDDADEDGDGDEEEDDDEDDELGLLELAGEEDDSEAEEIMYEDFYTSNKKHDQNKKPKVNKEVKDINMGDDEEHEDSDIGDEDGEEDVDEDDDDDDIVSDEETKKDNLSTHEKHLLEQRAKIEQVERENLEAKAWTMQGEVNATKRPKNSALGEDLDWERNVKPPPVITEEVSQSIEELIMKRISEGHFDDVQKVNKLPSKAPREMKELDENQSKKGLGELYADEYAQKTGLVSQALSFSDEQKKEASLLFKRLCLKLDALSHFHFTPKPVIEDMSIQTNVPALAMEEIAPLAVSDAAMLAPEEVFSGKGDIKEEAELTQTDRKRRRASKKRKFKAENAKKMAKKPRENTQTAGDGKEE